MVVLRRCLHCDEMFVDVPRRRGRKRIYCSKSCGNRARYSGVLPQPGNDGRQATCNYCGVVFSPTPRQVTDFCSRRCNNSHRNRAITLAGGRRKMKTCIVCGKDFMFPLRKKLCSHECRVEHRRRKDREGFRRMYRSNPNFRIASNLRNRLFQAMKRIKKPGSAVRDLGCTIPELRAYLESKFQPGMSWDNHGATGWHIDHIRPLSAFDLSDREQFLKAVHYTNLQPMWHEENFKKNAAAEWPETVLVLR